MLARGVRGGKNSKLIRGAIRVSGGCDVIRSVLQTGSGERLAPAPDCGVDAADAIVTKY
jgi:hypothetical protein